MWLSQAQKTWLWRKRQNHCAWDFNHDACVKAAHKDLDTQSDRIALTHGRLKDTCHVFNTDTNEPDHI